MFLVLHIISKIMQRVNFPGQAESCRIVINIQTCNPWLAMRSLLGKQPTIYKFHLRHTTHFVSWFSGNKLRHLLRSGHQSVCKGFFTWSFSVGKNVCNKWGGVKSFIDFFTFSRSLLFVSSSHFCIKDIYKKTSPVNFSAYISLYSKRKTRPQKRRNRRKQLMTMVKIYSGCNLWKTVWL